MQLFIELQDHYEEMVAIRRYLHERPELSFQEVHTPKYIANYYKELGFEVREKVGGRGVVAKLHTGKQGRTIALRADFVLAIDIGGTKLGGAVLHYTQVNKQPEIVFQDKVAAEAKKGVDALASNIIGLAKSLKAKAQEIDSSVPVIAIGMGCAGRINKDSGNVMTATDNFPGFVGYALTSEVSRSINVPAYALNDVQAHTMGEFR